MTRSWATITSSWAAFGISGCIGAALTLVMTVSGVVGTSVPLLFKKLGVDSGHLITTLNDLMAITVYYGFAHGCC